MEACVCTRPDVPADIGLAKALRVLRHWFKPYLGSPIVYFMGIAYGVGFGNAVSHCELRAINLRFAAPDEYPVQQVSPFKFACFPLLYGPLQKRQALLLKIWRPVLNE